MVLIRKELRALTPFFALVLFICGLNLADELFSAPVDMRPLAETFHTLVAPDETYSVVIFLLVFALGSGLLVREHDEGTMEFLDSLPVSRTRVFWTKVGLASLILSLLPLTNAAIAVFLHGWSRTSVDPGFHWQIIAASFLLYFCQTMVFLSVALAFSFLRRFGWLVVALVIWGYVFVHRFFPSVAVLNVFDLTTPHIEGTRWVLPVRLLEVQLPLAAALILVAYFVFVGAGDRMVRDYARLARNRAGAAVLLATGVVAVILLLVAVSIYVESDSPDTNAGNRRVARAVYASWTTGHAQTRFYTFGYPSNLAERAHSLIARADDAHEAVRRFLGADPSDKRIVVDLSGAAPRHAGNAYWDTVRMTLMEGYDDKRLLEVLAHETTHVYIDRLSDSRLTDTFNSTRFFHEGLATYIEHRLFGTPKSVAVGRSVAAVMRARREVDFAELVDDQLLRRKRDGNMVYPIGEVFVAALVERYGDSAPGDVLRAFGRNDRERPTGGRALWQDVFQTAGFSLEETVDVFFAKLDRLVEDNRQFINSLPRLRGKVLQMDGEIGVAPVWAPIDGWEPLCRFRPSANSEDHEYEYAEADSEGVFWTDRESFPGATFWFELGMRESDGERVIWEPWSEVRRK